MSLRDQIRSQLAGLAPGAAAPFARREPRPPLHPPDELYGVLPVDRGRPYDTHELLARLLDGSELDEYKATYGKSLVCGTGWIDGWAVGIVANQRSIVHKQLGVKGEKELQIGGVIYSDSADKGARFMRSVADLPGVVETRGRGLLLAAELDRPGAPVIGACMERGLLVGSAGENVLRFTPPLTIAPAELDTALEILSGVLQ